MARTLFVLPQLPTPEYNALKTLCAASNARQKEIVCVGIRLAAKQFNASPDGFQELVEAFRAQAPSDTPPLIALDRDGVPAVIAARAPETSTSPVVAPERRMRIQLHHRHSVNCVFYGPGASVDVPAEIAADLVMADRRADAVLPRGE